MFRRGKLIIIKGDTSTHAAQVGLYKILFYFEALLVIFFANHPLYCAIYCTILPLFVALAPARAQF